MNSASQLLRVLAIIGAIAAGVLFYLTNGKIADYQSKLNSAKSELTSAKAASDTDLQAAKDQLAAALTGQEDMQKKVKAALDEAELDKSRYEDAQKSLDDDDKAAKDKDAKISDLNAQVADAMRKADSVGALNEQIVTLTAENADLKQQIANLPVKGSGNNPKASVVATPPPAPVQLSPAFSAKVLDIDTNKWFLVLNVGTDSGVQSGTQLYLKLGDQTLGVVTVTTSEAAMSTGSISTDTMSPKDFAMIVKKGLQVDCQKAL